MVSMFHTNDQAPDFSLPDQNGKVHTLSDYAGKWMLLYFYPEDDTPGCTEEACNFRDHLELLTEKELMIVGVSVDSIESHKKFEEKYQLPFTLLSDHNKEAVTSYGVWAEKSMYGKTYMGTHRTSFLIRPDGTIAKIYEKVKPAAHVEEILNDMAAFAL